MANKPLFKSNITAAIQDGENVIYLPVGLATAWNNDGRKSVSLELLVGGKLVKCSFLIPQGESAPEKPAGKKAAAAVVDDDENAF